MLSLTKPLVKLHRKNVCRKVLAGKQRIVQYGPFRGYQFSHSGHISETSLALKYFGLYEANVIEWLVQSFRHKQFVNLGAGDGFFSIAVARFLNCERALCFEMESDGRAAIEENAKLNGVSDQIEITGAAEANFPSKMFDKYTPAETLLMCDVEGAEFEIFTPENVQALAGCTMIIEIHDQLMEPIPDRQEFHSRLEQSFDVELLKATPRNWANIPELESLHDNDRALLASEGRKVLGEWFVCTPKQS